MKIAYDVDNSQYFSFSYSHGGIVSYSSFWGIYYCVYLDNEFKYAVCDPAFHIRYQENYQDSTVPDRLYSTNEYSDLVITSGDMEIYSGGSNFLQLSVGGSCIKSYTPYSWTNDYDRIKGETETSTSTFSNSETSFAGSTSGGYYIINGGAEDFRNAVRGLYDVCRML